MEKFNILGLALILGFISFAAAFPAAAEVIHVDVNKMAYSPVQVTAHVGDVVEWVNNDIVAHTATEKGKKWEVMLPVKGKGSTTMKSEGTIEYYCKFHPNMVGKIEVVK